MRIRTFFGIVIALFLAVLVSYLTQQNIDLLIQEFRLTDTTKVPLYGIILAVFALGFLPTVGVLLFRTLHGELAARQARKRSRHVKSLQGSFRRAIDFQADGQWARAVAELEGVLAEQPEDFSTLLRHGEVLRLQGRGDEALDVHRRASVLYPQSVSLLYQLAEDYQDRGEGKVAREIRDRVLRDFPDMGLLICRRRRNGALAVEDWKEAARWQEKIEAFVKAGGNVTELEKEAWIRRGLLFQKGVALMEEEQLDEAKDCFHQILRDEPGFIPASIMIGEAALMSGRAKAALGEWTQGFASTGSPVFLQRIEDHFIEQGAPAEGIDTFRRLIASADPNILPRFYLGRFYYRLEMHEEALKVLHEVREELASSPTLHFILARIRERRGEMAKAAENYLHCVQQAGIDRAEFRCRTCRSEYDAWRARCESCGSWNSVDIDFQIEHVSAEELGLRMAPVWAVYDDGVESQNP